MAVPLLIPALIFALKALLIPLVSVVLYYVLFKFFMVFGETVIDWALSQIVNNTDLSATTIQLTGFSAWVADTMSLGVTISLLISFCVTRFIISLIRK